MSVFERLPEKCQPAVTAWRESLVDKKYQDADTERVRRQQKLLKAAKHSSGELASLMLTAADASEADLKTWPRLASDLTSKEMLKPQVETGEMVYKSLAGVTRWDAASGVFWLLCHIRWLLDGSFPDPSALGLIGTSADKLNPKMLNDHPRNLTGDERKFIDWRVRDLLRHTGGIPHVRDATAFMYDTPLAGAWWKVELCLSAAQASREAFTERDAHQVLLHRSVWEEWTRWVTRRAGKLAAPTALAGFVIAVRRRDKPTDAEQKTMMAKLARRVHGLHLDAANPHEIAELCL